MTLPPQYTRTPPAQDKIDACADIAAKLEEKLRSNAPAMARLEQERNRNPARDLADLQPFGPDGDPNELVLDRFLCKGSIAMLAGPTGIGKSTLLIQVHISWAVARAAFQLPVRRPVRTLIIQAENDDGDIAEMRDGIYNGLNLATHERAIAGRSVRIVREASATGEAFAALLAGHLQEAVDEGRPYDAVIIDPLLSYIGGAINDQAVVGPFLRNMLTPLAISYLVAIWLIHHTPKPPSNAKEKSAWSAGDFAYSGIGSSDLANCCRAILVLKNIGSPDIYKLIAAKRGKRLNWTRDADGLGDAIENEAEAAKAAVEAGLGDGDGQLDPEDDGPARVYDQYIAHSKSRKTIFWRTPTPQEVAELTGEGEAAASLLETMTTPWEEKTAGLDQADYWARAKSLGWSRRTAYNRWGKGLSIGLWKLKAADRKCYLTKKGRDVWREPVDHSESGETSGSRHKGFL